MPSENLMDENSVNIDGEFLSHLCVVDDIVITAYNLGDANQMVTKVEQAAATTGLDVNQGVNL